MTCLFFAYLHVLSHAVNFFICCYCYKHVSWHVTDMHVFFFAYLHVLSHMVNICMCCYRLQILLCQWHVTWAGMSRHMLLNQGHVPCWAVCVGTCLFFAYLNVSLHVANIYMCRYMLQTCVVTYPLLSSMCHDMPAFCLPTCVVTCNYFLAPIALLHFCIKILFYFLYTYIQDRACRVLPEAHHAPHLPAQLHQRNSAREWQQRTPTW